MIVLATFKIFFRWLKVTFNEIHVSFLRLKQNVTIACWFILYIKSLLKQFEIQNGIMKWQAVVTYCFISQNNLSISSKINFICIYFPSLHNQRFHLWQNSTPITIVYLATWPLLQWSSLRPPMWFPGFCKERCTSDVVTSPFPFSFHSV